MARIVEEIARLIETDPIDLDRLEELFDEASREAREEALTPFDTSAQRRLFEQAEGRDVELEDLVPPDVEPMREVVHQGRNTLPVFKSFQKRFCRPPETDDRLWGYNEQTFQMVTGPGYFVAHESESAGEILIDYRQLPDDHPDGWPEIVPNTARLGRFVYAGTVDRLRKVAERVVIGRAYVAEDDPMNAWFILARRDPT